MNTIKAISFVLLTALLLNCSNDDTTVQPTNAEQLKGSWKLTSGNFNGNQTKYAIFNGNNIKLLFQDELGFKSRFDHNVIENITETTFTYNAQGPTVYTYTISGNTLTVSESTLNTTATFTRNDDASIYDNWIQTINREVETATPWAHATDIEFINFDSNRLIIGYDDSSGFLSSLNTVTLSTDGGVRINREARAVTYDLGGDLFLHSNANDQLLYATETDGTEINFADLLLNMPINYLSYHNDNIWIASTAANTIIFHNDLGQEQYVLNKRPYGIEYTNGHLYISTLDYIHKCQRIENQLQAIETYEISDSGGVYGLTSDGNNLWINTQHSGKDDKLIKTDITF